MNDQCDRLWGNLKHVDVDTLFEQMFYLHGISSVVVGGNQPQALLSFILCFYLVIQPISK